MNFCQPELAHSTYINVIGTQGIATDIIVAFNCFNATQNFLVFQRLYLFFLRHLLATWGFNKRILPSPDHVWRIG
jgi:hypothetical protein